jgi:hypothetical protein
MRRAIIVLSVALFAATAAQGAPRFGSSSVSAGGSGAAAEEDVLRLAAVLEWFGVRFVKAKTDAPKPTDKRYQECEKSKSESDKQADKPRRSGGGPEPIYLAF